MTDYVAVMANVRCAVVCMAVADNDYVTVSNLAHATASKRVKQVLMQQETHCFSDVNSTIHYADHKTDYLHPKGGFTNLVVTETIANSINRDIVYSSLSNLPRFICNETVSNHPNIAVKVTIVTMNFYENH